MNEIKTTDRKYELRSAMANCEECGSWGGYIEHGWDGNGDPKVICPVCNGTGYVAANDPVSELPLKTIDFLKTIEALGKAWLSGRIAGTVFIISKDKFTREYLNMEVAS